MGPLLLLHFISSDYFFLPLEFRPPSSMESTILPLLLLTCFCAASTLGADVLQKAGVETKRVLGSAKTGNLIRECSCPEEQVCLGQMQGQVRECFHSCWGQEQQVTQLTSNSEQLKKCFMDKEHLIDEFVQCVKSSEETCVNTKAGPQIPYIDMNRLIGAGEQRLKAQAQAFLRTMGGQNQKLVKAAVDVGTCIKSCFVQKNGQGSCFDKSGCHPKLEEDLAGPVIKRCARQIGWKREAAEMCECALNAGVMSVKPYCQILRGSVKSKSDDIKTSQQ